MLFANTLVSTTPVAGAALQSAPSAVTVTTELPLLDVGNEITVTDPTGARVDDGALSIDLDSAYIGLKPLVKTGIYTVTYSLLAENDVPRLFPDGVGVGLTGSGATVSITEGSIKLNVNLPTSGTSFSARSE